MKRAHRASYVALCILFLSACSGAVSIADATSASIEVIRGTVKEDDELVYGRARIATGQTLHVGADSLARLTLDSGATLLVDSNAVLRLEENDFTVHVAHGRVFAEVGEASQLRVRVDDGAFLLNDAAISLECASGQPSRAYVVHGDVAWSGANNVRGTARAGEEVRPAGGTSAVQAVALWPDWSGGLARSGPTLSASADGIGRLEARLPGEVGTARWPLTMRRLDVRVRVQGDLAITEVDQEFFNPSSDVVEGLYRMNLPESALLSRFAVDRNGNLVDGYIREREQARSAYQAQVYRGSTDDPALLEWDADGVYHARIYPIAAGETRRIVVRYTEWLSRAHQGAPRVYRYRMAPGAGGVSPAIQEFSLEVDLSEAGNDVHVRAGMGATIEDKKVILRLSDLVPRADFWLELEGESEAAGLRAYRATHQTPRAARTSETPAQRADERDYFYLPVVLPEDLFAQAPSEGQDWVVIADVSAATDSAHLELGRHVIESLIGHLGARDRVAVVTSDLALRPLGGEPRVALGSVEATRITRLLDDLARVPAGGATDLGAAITEAASLLDRTRPSAVIYVGDGAPTVGELRADGLLARMGRLADPIRFYAIGVGADANLDLLDALTRQSGFAARVQESTQAADAALRLIAHASRPFADHVSVELGAGIRDVFPRGAMSLARGAALTLVGRVGESVPSEVRIRGQVRGRPFDRKVRIETTTLNDGTDLRLRWARERLRQLLVDGAGRESIVDLGVRYGVITPFTSFYVPSARELGAPQASHERESATQVAINLVFAPLALMGCSNKDAPAQTSTGATPLRGAEESPASDDSEDQRALMPFEQRQRTAPAVPTTPPTLAAPQLGPEQRVAFADTPRDVADAVAAAPPPDALELDETARDTDRDRNSGSADGMLAGLGGLGLQGSGRGGGGDVDADNQPVDLSTHSAGGTGRSARLRGETRSREPDELSTQAAQSQLRANVGNGPGLFMMPLTGTATTTVITTATTVRVVPSYHYVTRCSAASRVALADRIVLWRERMVRGANVTGALDVFRAALRDCEVNGSTDRRALVDVIVAQLSGVSELLAFYRLLDDGNARSYLRATILRRVRTAAELGQVRAAFGLSEQADWALVEQMLARAGSGAARIRILRDLRESKSSDFDLSLRLLSELEGEHRVAEAIRLSNELRINPAADAGVRTAIGELYVRLNRDEDARRVFSEIVEFAPHDELARRRLGDLYRAHGWFEDAYRQYQTLAEIRPDDAAVKLLLAQAAAGVGRIDEALRLEESLAETASGGAEQGLARTATLWSSVRLAKLREEARRTHDDAKLRALLARTRQSSAGRAAGALRVSLVWSHPDAALSLWAAYPNQNGLVRPTDTAPEYGIEALDALEDEAGTYRFEVRRGGRDTRTRIDAELVVVAHEGRADETTRVIPIHFEGQGRAFAWTFADGEVHEATPTRVPGEVQ